MCFLTGQAPGSHKLARAPQPAVSDAAPPCSTELVHAEQVSRDAEDSDVKRSIPNLESLLLSSAQLRAIQFLTLNAGPFDLGDPLADDDDPQKDSDVVVFPKKDVSPSRPLILFFKI